MAALIKKSIEWYHYVNDDLSDPRVVHYPLLANPLGIIIIIIAYNIFVQRIGPSWMEKRRPFNLKPLIIVFDFIQALVNFWMLGRIIGITYLKGNYNFLCQPVETGTSPEEVYILNTVYYYFLTKISDLIDTVFIILTKRSHKLSFLHLYHHSGMVLCAWLGMKYVPGGHAVFFGSINGLVHGFMYTYYLLSALKYLDSRHIFWKRSLTQLQMVQFALIFLHHLAAILNPSCNFPKFISAMLIPQNVFIFILFGDFYWKTYIKKNKKT